MTAMEEQVIEYATEVGGEYFREHVPSVTNPTPDVKVLTVVENWTIVLEGQSGSPFAMRAAYKSVDGFEFKLRQKLGLHNLLGRVFGSRDIDVADQDLQQHYSVEANNEEQARRFLAGQKFRNAWSRCVADRQPREVIKGLRIVRRKDAHEVIVQFTPLDYGGMLAVHDLVVESLSKLVDMGSASSEQVATPTVGKEWSSAERHIQTGLELSDEGKWDKAISEFTSAIGIDRNNVNAYAQRGLANAKSGRPDQAIADLKKVKELTRDPLVDELEAATKEPREGSGG